jgi:hypothetical protein
MQRSWELDYRPDWAGRIHVNVALRMWIPGRRLLPLLLDVLKVDFQIRVQYLWAKLQLSNVSMKLLVFRQPL